MTFPLTRDRSRNRSEGGGAGGNNPFNQPGATLDLAFAGVVSDLPNTGPSIGLNFASQYYQLGVQYAVWVAGSGLTQQNFADIVTFTRASTATYFNSSGVLTSAAINVPRFDYDPATLAARGFLIEEARTNSVLYSQNQTIERRITLTGISGTFLAGETVTATGGGTGTIYAVIGSVVELTLAAGTFTGTLTSSGGATGTIASIVVTYFYTAAGTGVIPVATQNYAVAPDGTTTATRIIFDKGAGTTTSDQSNLGAPGFIVTAGQPQTASVWLKSNTGSTYTVRFDFNGLAADAGGTSSTLTVTPTWQRFTIALSSAIDTLRTTTLRLRGTLGTSDYADILVWGWQQEVDRAFSTSYIPTTTTALTRSADVASVNTLSPWFNATEGTLFAEYVAAPVTSGQFPNVAAFRLNSPNNSQNTAQIFATGTLTAVSNGLVRVTNVDQISRTASGVAFGSTIKSALAMQTDNMAFYVNGAIVGAVDTSGSLITFGNLQIGSDVTPIRLNSHIRRITYYPRRLSNAELQAITT